MSATGKLNNMSMGEMICMKMTVAMMVTYGVGGVAAALAPRPPLDTRLAVIALLLLYSVHVFWIALARKRECSSSPE